MYQWMVGMGGHTDWLEDPTRLREGLETLTQLVDSGAVAPVLDKVLFVLILKRKRGSVTYSGHYPCMSHIWDTKIVIMTCLVETDSNLSETLNEIKILILIMRNLQL
jgi:hypothetical protein